ncbi:MAG: hypothetical protein HQK79_13580 [Desulfobacterales bacterium]|nr:hypothetical protein [Desulfobacterales bacterium]
MKPEHKSKQERDDYDSPWKDMIENYLKDFLYFFFPKVAENIDWEKGYKFLDNELRKVVRDAKLGKRLADKLIEVYLKDDSETWILIHIEVQGQHDSGLSERIYVYNYRIFDCHRKPVVSLVVLSDEHPNWKPDSYGYSVLECEVSIKFPVVKLLDYKERWQELEAEKNVFSIVVMTHLKTLETKKDSEYRKIWKVNLIKHMYDKGYKGEDIINIFHFIDWLMRLPEELEEGFWKEVREYEEVKHMQYITSVERIGMKKGILIGEQLGFQKGAIQEAKELVLEALETKFDIIHGSIIEKIEQIGNTSVLKSLLKKAIKAENIAQFEMLMNQALQ